MNLENVGSITKQSVIYYAKTFGKNEIHLYITTQGGRIIWRLLEFSPLSFDRISICDFSHSLDLKDLPRFLVDFRIFPHQILKPSGAPETSKASMLIEFLLIKIGVPIARANRFLSILVVEL